MDITSSIYILDKKLQSIGLKDTTKSKVLDLIISTVTQAAEKTEVPESKLIDLYSREIVEVVANNRCDKNVCEKYAKFAISKIVESIKEKK